jgi:hypothetical protein
MAGRSQTAHPIMENRTPFDLNEAIRRWQQNLGASPALNADNVEELVSHLRASVQRLQADGLSVEEAFLAATRRLGERAAMEREFAKVRMSNSGTRFTLCLVWLAVGIGLALSGYFYYALSLRRGASELLLLIILPSLLIPGLAAYITSLACRLAGRRSWHLGWHFALSGPLAAGGLAGCVLWLGVSLQSGGWGKIDPMPIFLWICVPGPVFGVLPAVLVVWHYRKKLRDAGQVGIFKSTA